MKNNSISIVNDQACELNTKDIYEFRISLEKRIQEMRELGVDLILIKIYEKTVDSEWILNEIYVVSRNNLTKHQDDIVSEKAGHQRSSTIKVAMMSLSIFCQCGDAFISSKVSGAPPLCSLLFKGGAKYTDSILSNLQDSKEFNITKLDNTNSRISMLIQDLTGNLSKNNPNQFIEKLSQAIEASHRAKTSIFQK